MSPIARGNDSAAALADLRGQYGQYGGNAEDMIAASRAAVSPQLRAASLLPVNRDATVALLDGDGLAKADGKLDDAKAVDLSVRGHWVVVLAETDSGRTFKEAYPYSDFGGPKAGSEVAQKRIDLGSHKTTEEEHEAALARMAQANEAAKAAQEAEDKVQEARDRARASRSSKDKAEDKE